MTFLFNISSTFDIERVILAPLKYVYSREGWFSLQVQEVFYLARQNTD